MSDAVVPLAELHDYLDLQRVMRARAEDLQLSRIVIDTIAGIPDGYSSKLLAPSPIKCAGHKNLMPLLGALALKLVVVEDDEALARLKSRIEKSRITPAERDRQRFNNRNHQKARAANMTNDARIPAPWRASDKHEAGRRILGYYLKHRFDPTLPTSPWNDLLGRCFLPAHLARDYRSTRLPPLPEKELPDMPRYRANLRQNFAGREVEIGEEFAWCGWPERGMTPLNTPAHQVAEYFEANRTNSHLLSSPWCELEGLTLPELPAPPKRARGMNTSGDVTADEFYAMREPIAPLAAPLRAKRSVGTKRRGVDAA